MIYVNVSKSKFWKHNMGCIGFIMTAFGAHEIIRTNGDLDKGILLIVVGIILAIVGKMTESEEK